MAVKPSALLEPLELSAIVLSHKPSHDRSELSKVSKVHQERVLTAESPDADDTNEPMPVAETTKGHDMLIADCFASVASFRYALRQSSYFYFGTVIQLPQTPVCPVSHICLAIAAAGNLDVLREARAVGFPWDWNTAVVAARGGHIHILDWITGAFQTNPVWLQDEACIKAAVEGSHPVVLEWLWARGCGKHGDSTIMVAVKIGNVEMLKWAWKNGCSRVQARPTEEDSTQGEIMKTAIRRDCESKSFIAVAAGLGHKHVVKWLHKHGVKWTSAACVNAAREGELEMLQMLREYNCPWNKSTCAGAAISGHLEVLIWLREQVPPCPWDSDTVLNAETEHHEDVAEYARDNGCPEPPLQDWG